MSTPLTTGTAPGALPLVGHSAQLLWRPLRFLTSLPRHGDLVRVRLGPRVVYVPCHPEIFRHVFKNDHIYDKGGPYYDRARDVVGNSLVTSRWAEHRQQRKIMQPSFDHSRVGRYASLMTEEADTMMTTWRPGDIVDVARAMESHTQRVTTRALFGMPADHHAVVEMERSLPILVEGVYRRMLVPPGILSLFPSRTNRRYNRARARIWRLTEEIIHEGRRQSTHQDGLLSALLCAHSEETDELLTNQEIFDQVVIVLLAGTETTAKTLGFTFYLLAKHPDVEDRVHREIDAALAGRSPTFEDLAQLTYTRQVITESLRLYPPTWIFTRVTTAADELAGHQLPKGATLLLSPYLLHRDPSVFPNPESFDPDRWRPDKARTTPRGAMLAFGMGSRKCIGDQFALTEATLTMATIAARWRLRPPAGMTLRPTPRATLCTGPLLMTLHNRR